MGQLTQKLNIDACPNCGSEDFDLLPPDEQAQYREPTFGANCTVCGISYTIEYIIPGASYGYNPSVDENIFYLFARNI